MPSSVPPQPSADPEPGEPTTAPGAGESVEEAAPLNRAARRAKARQAGPSHVGPREELERRIRGAGAARKRRR